VDSQLIAIVDELESARQRVHALGRLPREAWSFRPEPGAWTAAQCIEHLNLTSEMILPLLAEGLVEARKLPARAPVPYWRDPVGWAIWKMMAPDGGKKIRTVAALEPPAACRFDVAAGRFERLQSTIVELVAAGHGLALDQVRLPSPFDARVRYNLYAIFTLTPRHQHRHLAQAERAVEVFTELGDGASTP